MKTTVCLPAIVAVLTIGLYAQSDHVNVVHSRRLDPTIGPIVPLSPAEDFPNWLQHKNRKEAASAPGTQSPAAVAVPAEVMDLAKEAKKQFALGDFREAEKIYDRALAIVPNNLYLLSNKGVVLFREQKYQLAEEAFKKAIVVGPEDDFSYCTLGIVEYQQAKLYEAMSALAQAIALNPKNATAHNYLGITVSQKGWKVAAQMELEIAVELDPAYADAQFNLAVVLSTQAPPDKKAAREHYRRAIELGAERDTSMEELIK